MSEKTSTRTVTPMTPAAYWRKTRQLTLALLGLWFVVTFVTLFFARQLNRIDLVVFGRPLSFLPFYMAAQVIMLAYLAIVAVYTLWMRRAERRLRLHHRNGKRHGN